MSQLISCRSCGENDLTTILALGNTPLANSLLREVQCTQPESTYPLELVFCPQCSLVQITVSVPPEELFSEYVYFSSFSTTMLQHAQALATKVIARQKLSAKNHVIEIASNDGYLLQYYQQAGMSVLGIEPATNIAKVANKKGIRTLPEFFGIELAQQISEQQEFADVIHAHNVLAHVPDVNGVVEGFKVLLKDDGVVIIETPYVKDLIDKIEFDTIYHEHLFYYSLTALDALFSRHGLTICDVERLSIHGGSLRIYAGHSDLVTPNGAVKALLAEEQDWGVDTIDFYADFAARVESLKKSLTDLLTQLKQEGKTIAAYGASAKGSTLLNYFGIGAEVLEFVADRSTVKQGMYTPGTHLPIYPPEKLLEDQPDYMLLLVWNFANEVMEQQAEYRQRGGKFIIPIPEVRVV